MSPKPNCEAIIKPGRENKGLERAQLSEVKTNRFTIKLDQANRFVSSGGSVVKANLISLHTYIDTHTLPATAIKNNSHYRCHL